MIPTSGNVFTVLMFMFCTCKSFNKNTAWTSWQKLEFNENNCLVSSDCNYAEMLLCAFSLNILFRIVWYSVCKGIAHSCMMVSRCRQDGVMVNSLLLSESIFGNMHELRKKNVFIFVWCSIFVGYFKCLILIFAQSLWGLPPTSFYSVLFRIVTGVCFQVPVF